MKPNENPKSKTVILCFKYYDSVKFDCPVCFSVAQYVFVIYLLKKGKMKESVFVHPMTFHILFAWWIDAIFALRSSGSRRKYSSSVFRMKLHSGRHSH